MGGAPVSCVKKVRNHPMLPSRHNPERISEFIKKWIKALNPKNDRETTKVILKDILAGYVACTDSPCYMFAGELAEAYPDAKVIVTTRDPEKWWVSFSELLKTVMPWWVKYVFWSMPTLRWFGQWSDGMKKRSENSPISMIEVNADLA